MKFDTNAFNGIGRRGVILVYLADKNVIFDIKFLVCIPITYVYRIKMIFNNEYGWLNAKDSKRLKISYPFLDASKINPNNCS